MLSVTEARERVLAELRPTTAEVVSLAVARGRVLAETVIARLANPPHDVSAMDGYALAASGVAAGARLRVVGSAPAGHPWPNRIGAGEALRLFTGSVVPAGAEAVVIQEDTALEGDWVTLREPPVPGRHIRRAGQDFDVGAHLLEAGRVLDARAVGLAAAGNHAWLRVHRRPRIAILATGDEVALPGESIPNGGIVSSNGHALAALVHANGGEPVLLPIARDDTSALLDGVLSAKGCDMLVTTGGASVGDHDLVRQTLQGEGMTLEFWKVAMRPGKPLLYGLLNSLPVLGLPGNPVSTLVTAILFLRPALQRLAGLPALPPPVTKATLAAALPLNDHREDYLRARLITTETGWQAEAMQRQDSGMLRALADADGLIVRPPYAPAAPAGSSVSVIRLLECGA